MTDPQSITDQGTVPLKAAQLIAPPNELSDEISEDVVTAAISAEIVEEAERAVQAAATLQHSSGWEAADVQALIGSMAARVMGAPNLLFDEYRDSPDDRAIRIAAGDESIPVWFIGDLHGDLFSLEVALRYIRSQAENAKIVFLGDLFDAGPHGAAVVLRVWTCIEENPLSICVLAGNHDEALTFDGDRFSSSVTPSDLSGWLNDRLDAAPINLFGKTLTEFFAKLPRALFFPDGLLVSHGGIPLSDVHGDLRASGNWNAPLCMQDFVWTRWYPRKRRVRPHRNARDIGLGFATFAEFCILSAELGRPVSRLLRGHTHVDDCYESCALAEDRGVLTINTMCTRSLLRADSGPYERQPVVARRRPGLLPQVHRLAIPPVAISRVYPEPDPGA